MNINIANRLSRVEEYYFSTKLREIATLQQRGIDVINLGIGSPDLMPHQSIIDKLCSASQDPSNHAYQSYRGIIELRSAISNWYMDKFNVALNAEQEILPLLGSKEGIMHISMTYLQEGDEILVPNPGYPSYSAAAQLAGATVITYGLVAKNNWLPDLEYLENTDLSRVKIMWINYPHMPTGATASASFFEHLIAFALRNNILICHDNPYAFILNNDALSILSAKRSKEVAIELNSFSKTFNMAGWRVGFMAGKAERIQEVLRFKSNMDSGMFKPQQLAAAQALSLPNNYYAQLNRTYSQRRKVAAQILDALNCEFDPSQVGLFIWAKISNSDRNDLEYVDYLLNKHQIFITPGSIFGSNGSGYIRISLCNSVETLNKALLSVM